MMYTTAHTAHITTTHDPITTATTHDTSTTATTPGTNIDTSQTNTTTYMDNHNINMLGTGHHPTLTLHQFQLRGQPVVEVES